MTVVHQGRLAAWLGAAMVALLPACRKPAESAGEQLQEAGYQLTTQDWMRAASEDNVVAMRKYLASGFALDTRDAHGDTALHAAAAGSELAADFLLDHGQPVDQRGASERTPLMVAVIHNNPRMVGWLLRQGADPHLKDQDGYTALMLAVRENSTKVVGELAVHVRDTLDGALLAAALEGRAEMIDALTKYGASVYARMEDGRTALMLAAQNNHEEAVRMLMDLGCGRFAVTPEGRTAADLALEEGHQQVANLILAKPVASELALEPPATIAAAMEEYVEASTAGDGPATAVIAAADPAGGDAVITDDPNPAAATPRQRPPVGPITDRTLAKLEPAGGPGRATAGPTASPATGGIPLVMRHYRQREMPLEVRTVSADAATFRIPGAPAREVTVKAGEPLPGSSLMVVGFHRKIASSKENLGKPAEISVVELKDPGTGVTRELVAGVPATAHDPIALVEDTGSGDRYTASPGQRFRDADGREYRVVDVRPNQLIIEDLSAGTVQTLPLRGPRG